MSFHQGYSQVVHQGLGTAHFAPVEMCAYYLLSLAPELLDEVVAVHEEKGEILEGTMNLPIGHRP